MPRGYRQESETGYYHVMTRGINKDYIFGHKSDKEFTIRVIKEKNSESLCKIFSYCIMDNHLHLLVESSLDNLSLLMKRIKTSYAFYYNTKNNRIGPVFQDRFKSEVISSEGHFLGALRYIHNNPVIADIVPHVEAYKWSSMKEYIEDKSYIIDIDALDYIKDYFKTINSLREFHLTKDDNDYLEIKEEHMRYKDNLGKVILTRYLKLVNKDTVDELKNKDDLILQLLNEGKFTYREIGELVRCSVGKVSNVNKVSRP